MQRHNRAITTFPRTRRSRWLRALGVMTACAGGLLAYYFMRQSAPIASLAIRFLLTIGLSSLGGAFFWRGWRALLVVPVALWLGAVAGDVLNRAIDHLPFGAGVVMALDLLVLAALPAVVGAALGVMLDMWLERRLGARGGERTA